MKSALAKKTPPADRVFRAFADRTRLRILHLLGAAGETCVCDLVDVLDVPQPKVSRHLAYLRRAGLVRARKDGLWQHYTLAPARNAFHAKLLDCLGCCFGDVAELTKDRQRLGLANAARRRAGKCSTRCC